MSKDPCSAVSGLTATCLAKRAPFIFGLFTFTILVFSSINGDTTPPTDKELTSFIYLSGVSKEASANCKKPTSSHAVCAGVIYSKRYIVTAASCLKNEKLRVHLGMLRNYTTKVLHIKNGYQHSGYTSEKDLIKNDVAILRPAGKVELSTFVTHAKFAKDRHNFTIGALCHAIILTEDPKEEFRTRKANLTIIEPSKCNISGPTEMCLKQKNNAGLKLNGTALWCPRGKTKNKYVVAGILSRIRANYTIYTNIAHYRDWIEMIRRN